MVPGPVKLSSGVLIIYADEESFTFMTPEGHVLAAWITFSALQSECCYTAADHSSRHWIEAYATLATRPAQSPNKKHAKSNRALLGAGTTNAW